MELSGFAICNIERAEVITEEDTAKAYTFDTASECTAEPNVSAGNEQELRVKDQILAQNVTQDIVKGYNLTLKDSTFSPEVFAIVDGGVSSFDSDEEFTGYVAPTAGTVSSRTKFRLAVYAAEKDYDGDIMSYVRFSYPHSVGSPASIGITDGEFYAPSYTIKSKPKRGESPVYIDKIPKLPEYIASASDIEVPTAGVNVYCATASITYNTKNYNIGDIIIVSAAE